MDNEKGVFVSYAWGGESERMVEALETAFAERDIRIISDKKGLEYKDSVQGCSAKVSVTLPE